VARTRNLRPTEGARFVLEREPEATPVRTSDVSIDPEPSDPSSDAPIEAAPTRASYRASIYTPDADFVTTATLAEDGSVIVGVTGAPGDLDERLKNIAKVVARDAPKRRDDGLVVWPARIMRWRK
jgi:hypothetical protein